MSNKKLIRAVLFVLTGMIIVCVTVMGYMLYDTFNKDVMTVDLDVSETHTVEFDNLCLVPGESCEYTISLESNMAQRCTLSLNFNEVGGRDLKRYARVRIEANGEVIEDELLATVIENGDIVTDADFTTEHSIDLKVVYYLPLDVGNEAQDAEAIFELEITANGIG